MAILCRHLENPVIAYPQYPEPMIAAIVLYCIFVLLEESVADRTQQMEQANLTNVHSR